MKSYKQTTRENQCQIVKRFNKNYNTHSFATYKNARDFLACLPSLCVSKIWRMCASFFATTDGVATTDEEFLYIGNFYGDARFKISDLCDFILSPLTELKDTVFAFQFNKFLTSPHKHVVTWLKQTKLKTHYVAKNNYKNGINVVRHRGVVTIPRFDQCLFEQIFDAFYQRFIFHPTTYMSYIISSYIKSIINKHYFDEWWNTSDDINELHMLRVKLKIFNSLPISARFEKKYIPDWKKIELVCEMLPTSTIWCQNHIIKDVDNVAYNMLACFANIGLGDMYKKLNTIYTLFSPDIISRVVSGYDFTCDQIILRDYSLMECVYKIKLAELYTPIQALYDTFSPNVFNNYVEGVDLASSGVITRSYEYWDVFSYIIISNPVRVLSGRFKTVCRGDRRSCVDDYQTELFNDIYYANAFDYNMIIMFQFFIHTGAYDLGTIKYMNIPTQDIILFDTYTQSIKENFLRFFGNDWRAKCFYQDITKRQFRIIDNGFKEGV